MYWYMKLWSQIKGGPKTRWVVNNRFELCSVSVPISRFLADGKADGTAKIITPTSIPGTPSPM